MGTFGVRHDEHPAGGRTMADCVTLGAEFRENKGEIRAVKTEGKSGGPRPKAEKKPTTE